jgi:flavin reductase (DIM6/NTAB) family NADH-FMN oxidoreductase RutF
MDASGGKTTIGPKSYLYPMPVVLVGANVGGKPNYMTLAYCGIAQMRPPMIMCTLGRIHYTNAGIKENRTFSVNIPAVKMVVPVDYCGLVSGEKVDKSQVFTTFYGVLDTAPMAAECPVNLECRLVDVLDYGGTNELFMGEIVEVHVNADCLDIKGMPDVKKIDPLLFSQPDNSYWTLGTRLAPAWHVGREMEQSGD